MNKKFKNEIVNTIIGEDTNIKGSIHAQRSIRIEGGLEGEVSSQGEVYVGENSKIKANVFGSRVIIAGEVTGNIEATNGLEILKTGKVYGDITGDQLVVEEGAIYKGKVNMDVISTENPYEGKAEYKKEN
ncbi:polymer-forming cytoskeletal protein [Thermoproteota archaeon]